MPYKAFRFYLASGYVDIQAETEEEARKVHSNELITISDNKKTFVCLSLVSAHHVELIEE